MTDDLATIEKTERKIDASGNVIEEKILHVSAKDFDEVKKEFNKQWGSDKK